MIWLATMVGSAPACVDAAQHRAHGSAEALDADGDFNPNLFILINLAFSTGLPVSRGAADGPRRSWRDKR
jgi:hypothetical protein